MLHSSSCQRAGPSWATVSISQHMTERPAYHVSSVRNFFPGSHLVLCACCRSAQNYWSAVAVALANVPVTRSQPPELWQRAHTAESLLLSMMTPALFQTVSRSASSKPRYLYLLRSGNLFYSCLQHLLPRNCANV